MEPEDLYGLPLEEFTAARNTLAQSRPEAKGLRKPSVAAYAVNQLARRHANELDAFLGAAAQLRHAQLKGGDVRAATQEVRQALQRLVQLAGEYAGSAQLDRVRQTLNAAAVDERAAEAVRAGQLERELEPGGFGTLVAGPAPKRRAPRRNHEAERDAERARRAALREAQAELRDAERALEQARERVDAAERRVRELEG